VLHFATPSGSARFDICVAGGTLPATKEEVVNECNSGLYSGIVTHTCLSPRPVVGRFASVQALGWCILLGLLAPLADAQPVIVAAPQSETVAPGSLVTLSVVADGSPPLRYWWRRNGRLLPTRRPTLRFRATRLRAGSYMVAVRDASGQVQWSNPAVVQVVTPPIILAQPQDVTVREHDTAVFTVKLNNSGPYTTIVWHNDNPREGPHEIPDGLGFDVHSPTLAIPNSLNVDYYNGIYWLAVTNAAGGTVSRKATLTVLPAAQ